MNEVSTVLSQYLVIDDKSIHLNLAAALDTIKTQNALKRLGLNDESKISGASNSTSSSNLGKRRHYSNSALPQQTTQSKQAAAALLTKWTTRLTSLCSSEVTSARLAGLSLVSVTIDQCPHLLAANASNWSSAGLAMLNRPMTTSARSFVISALAKLYRSTKGLPEVTRSVTASHLPKFLGTVLSLASSEPSLSSVVLSSVNSLISAHPGICKPSGPAIQAVCVKVLTTAMTDQGEVVDRAVETLAGTVLLAGRNGIPEAWATLLEKTLGSAQKELAELVDCIREDIAYPPYEGPLLLLPNESSSEQDYFSTLHRHLIRTALLLQLVSSLLRLPLDTALRVPISNILRTITRIFNISLASQPKNAGYKAEASALVAGISKLYPSCMSLLVSLVEITNDHALQYSSQIRSILLRLLGFSEGKPRIRALAHGVIAQLCEPAGIQLIFPIAETALIATTHDLRSLCYQVAASVKSDDLDTSSTTTDHTLAKKRGGVGNAPQQSSDSPKLSLVDSQLALSALSAATAMLTSFGPALGGSTRQEFDSVLVGMLTELPLFLPTSIVNSAYNCLAATNLHRNLDTPSRLAESISLLSKGAANNGLGQVDPLFRTRLPPLQRFLEPASFFKAPEDEEKEEKAVAQKQVVVSEFVSTATRLAERQALIAKETVAVEAPKQVVDMPKALEVPKAVELPVVKPVAAKQPTQMVELPKPVIEPRKEEAKPAPIEQVESKPVNGSTSAAPVSAPIQPTPQPVAPARAPEKPATTFTLPKDDDSDSDDLPEIVLDEDEDEEMADGDA